VLCFAMMRASARRLAGAVRIQWCGG